MIRSTRSFLSLSLLLTIVVNLAAQSATPKFGKDSIEKVVAAMTTEE